MITRPHVCEIALGQAEADDQGTIRITAWGTPFEPAEARQFAAEILAAADTADTYRAEQGLDERR